MAGDVLYETVKLELTHLATSFQCTTTMGDVIVGSILTSISIWSEDELRYNAQSVQKLLLVTTKSGWKGYDVQFQMLLSFIKQSSRYFKEDTNVVNCVLCDLLVELLSCEWWDRAQEFYKGRFRSEWLFASTGEVGGCAFLSLSSSSN